MQKLRKKPHFFRGLWQTSKKFLTFFWSELLFFKDSFIILEVGNIQELTGRLVHFSTDNKQAIGGF